MAFTQGLLPLFSTSYTMTFSHIFRNCNELLSHFLESAVKRVDHPRVGELITSMCHACPDLLARLIKHLAPLLAPRWSEKWENRMDFVIQVGAEIYVPAGCSCEFCLVLHSSHSLIIA